MNDDETQCSHTIRDATPSSLTVPEYLQRPRLLGTESRPEHKPLCSPLPPKPSLLSPSRLPLRHVLPFQTNLSKLPATSSFAVSDFMKTLESIYSEQPCEAT